MRWGRQFFENSTLRERLLEGHHIHTITAPGGEHCHGGDSECDLWQLQLEEALEAWT